MPARPSRFKGYPTLIDPGGIRFRCDCSIHPSGLITKCDLGLRRPELRLTAARELKQQIDHLPGATKTGRCSPRTVPSTVFHFRNQLTELLCDRRAFLTERDIFPAAEDQFS